MLRRIVAGVAMILLAPSLPIQAHADPVEDDGDTVKGAISVFRGGSRKKTISHKGMVLYQGAWMSWDRARALLDACQRSGRTDCAVSDVYRIREADLQATAVRLATQLRLPVPTPTFGPDPSVNEWNMLTVGFPIWLWTDGVRTVADTDSADGLTFRLAARLRSTTFAMGDGQSVTCTTMSRYSDAVKAGAPSPDCGYVYSKPSLPQGSYTVTATAQWDVTWSVAGRSGVLPVTRTASRELPIGELVALNR
ncbi:hypothetical protein [Micropruina sp.]|uniref:hypothetical protein n=1 Tax=Micropruina sp. TaxID=2737536 RepID=UPI0039E63DDB